MFSLVGNIISCFDNHDYLKEGDNLLCDKNTPIMRLVHDTIQRVCMGIVTNYIAHCDRVPQPHPYLQRSIDGIQPQSNPS